MNTKLAHSMFMPVLALVAVACASQTPPATATPPQPAAAAEQGEHTMPNGSKMEGHKHGESATHTMPDGTVMPGHSHSETSGGEE